MFVDKQHTATGRLDDGFYLIETLSFGLQVFRVKTQPTWAGQQVIALAKTPQARTFIEWCVITDGAQPVALASAERLRQAGVKDERIAQEMSRRTAAMDGRLYRLNRPYRDAALDSALMAATHALLDSEATQEQAGRMYARHFGRCRVCNRKLTHPDSVETGIGPECAGTRKHIEVAGDAA